MTWNEMFDKENKPDFKTVADSGIGVNYVIL